MYVILLLLFIALCVVLTTVILMQSGRGQGLAGAFGGGEMQTMLGPRATDFLEKLTWGGVTLFFVMTIILSFFVSQRKGSLVDKVQMQAPPVQQQQTMPATATQPAQAVSDVADEAANAVESAVSDQPVVPASAADQIPQTPVGDTAE